MVTYWKEKLDWGIKELNVDSLMGLDKHSTAKLKQCSKSLLQKNDVQIWLDLINVKEMLICQAFEFLALRWNIKCRSGVVLFSRLLPSWRSRQLLHLPEVACLQLPYLLEQLRKKKKKIKLYAIGTNTMQHLEFFQGTSLSSKPVQGYKCSHPPCKGQDCALLLCLCAVNPDEFCICFFHFQLSL